MDCARHQFFARTGLAQDNYISLGRCDSGNLGQDFMKRRAVAKDVPEAGPKFVLEKLVLELEVFLFGDAAQRHHPAEHFAAIISVGSGFHIYPMQSAILAFHFELEAPGLLIASLVSGAAVLFRVSAQQVRSLAQEFLRGSSR